MYHDCRSEVKLSLIQRYRAIDVILWDKCLTSPRGAVKVIAGERRSVSVAHQPASCLIYISYMKNDFARLA